METVTRNPSKQKAKAAKAPKKDTKPNLKPNASSGPVVDVPNAQQKAIDAFIKGNKATIGEYLKANFDEIGDAEIASITKETAECVILKRSPKVGGAWGDDTSVIEDVIRKVQGPTIAVVDPNEPLEDAEPVKAQEPEEDDGIEEEIKAPAKEKAEPVAAATEESEEIEIEAPKKKAKPTSKTSAKKGVKEKPKKDAKPATKKAATKKEIKAVEGTAPTVTPEYIKSLKGKDQWFAAARYLKGKKKIWIQTQDIPEVIGHLFAVSQGKEKLNEEGFKGKGEKAYRRNRILGFKDTIEAFLKDVK